MKLSNYKAEGWSMLRLVWHCRSYERRQWDSHFIKTNISTEHDGKYGPPGE